MHAATATATTDLTAENNQAPTSPLSKSLDCGQLDLGRAALMMADRSVEPDNWIGHIPFAFWLIETHRPNVLVELGTHTGNSYCAFCQAVSRLQLPTSCTAVDSWGGDPQAGFYGEEIYRELSDYHDRRYASFSSLLRTTFDEAVEQFADGSIDLLHIDGFHTYDAVRHDFETWRAKLSDRAIVLFHDVNERGSDFGAWRVWEELTRSHPSFTFLHSHGLGVLAVGATQGPAVAALLAANEDETATSSIRTAFSRLGRGVNAERLLAREIAAHQELAAGVASLAADRDRHAHEAERLRVEHELLTREAAAHQELAAGVASLVADRDRHAHEAERLRVEHQRLVAQAGGLEATARQMQDERRRLETAVRNVGRQLDASREQLYASREHEELLQARGATLAEQLRAGTAQFEALLGKERRRRRKMTRSLSWRLTKPVRMIGSLAKRAVKQPRTMPPELEAPAPAAIAPAAPAPTRHEPLPLLLPPYFHDALKYAEPEPFRESDAAARPRLCCLVHLYYIDLWDEIAALLRNLSGLDHQILVNFVESTVSEEVLARVAAEFPDARVLVSPNEGRDVGGILRLAALAELDRFDAVMVLHGKRSATLPPEWGTAWRQVLMQPLIGSATIARLNAALMAADPGCGMIASASCSSTFMGDNRPAVDMLAEKLGIPPEHRTAPFVAGSMFLIRPELMREMIDGARDLRFASADTAGAASVIDGQLEHALERIYGALTVARGRRVVWRDTRVSEVDLGLG